MKNLIYTLALALSLFTFLPKAEAAYSYYYRPVKIQPLYQYQRVNGYYKPSTGTYVSPYYRGVSNSVKFDNLNYYYNGLNGKRIYPNR